MKYLYPFSTSIIKNLEDFAAGSLDVCMTVPLDQMDFLPLLFKTNVILLKIISKSRLIRVFSIFGH